MTDREKHIAQRKKEIAKLHKQQLRLILKAVKIAAKPCKRQSTGLRRVGKAMAIAFQIKMIETQKQIIIAQPIPKFPPGTMAPGGKAIVENPDPNKS